MLKAVFLDRDGVINSDIGHYYIYKPEDFIINEGFIDSLKLLKNNGFIFIVISNQGGVSKGIYHKNDVEAVHDELKTKLLKTGIDFHEIYYCPHHPEKEKCICRKPDSLMIEKALARFNIDPAKSFMIGDSDRDIIAATNAGVRGIKIQSNQNIKSIIDQILDAKL